MRSYFAMRSYFFLILRGVLLALFMRRAGLSGVGVARRRIARIGSAGACVAVRTDPVAAPMLPWASATRMFRLLWAVRHAFPLGATLCHFLSDRSAPKIAARLVDLLLFTR